MNKTKCLATAITVFLCAGTFSFETLAADTNAATTAETKHAPKRIKPAEAQKLISEKKVVVLDVRTPEEFAAGHIVGATNIDFHAADFQTRIAKLDKNQAYLVHCASGVRSAKACDAMTQLDFSTLYDLRGGIAAWTDLGLPVEK